jgi:uncharacterized cupin superfamily protein
VKPVTAQIEVVPAAAGHTWQQLARPQGDTAPPGEEVILFRSQDARMSCGFWRRGPETGSLAPPFDEIMLFTDGEVEVTPTGGEALRVGAGDILAAPNGSSSVWHSFSPVRKFWAVHHGDPEGRAVGTVLGSGRLAWRPSSVPADDGHAPGRELVVFASGRFSTGLWERDRSDRDFERAFDEVSFILEGESEVTAESGRTTRLRPGDVFITPRGSRGHWRFDERVRKFWATYE